MTESDMYAQTLVSSLEDGDAKRVKSALPHLPESISDMSDGALAKLCSSLKKVRDHPRTLDFALIRNENVIGKLCGELKRQGRDVQIAIGELVGAVCEPDMYQGFAGSEACTSVLQFSLKSFNEDAMLPLIQCLSLYIPLLQPIGLEPRLLSVISRTLRDCSYEPLVLASYDCLLTILNSKSECSLRAAYEAELIPTLLIYIGNPNVEIKRRTMVALTSFKDAPYAVDPLATQGIANLMHALISSSEPSLKKMTIDILTSIAQAKAEYRDSLIIHNFAPICINILTGTEYTIKLETLHLLLLILKDRQRQHIDELVENNLASVLCRIAQREDALREKSLDCIDSILIAGGADGMYKALFKECRLTKLLLTLRTSPCGDIATRMLSQHFPKELTFNPAQAAPFLRQNQGFGPQNGPIAGQNAQVLGQMGPIGGQNVPIAGLNVPIVGQNVPIVGQNAPIAGQKAVKTRPKKAKSPPKGHATVNKAAKAATGAKGGIQAGKGVNVARLRATVRSGVTFPIPAIYRRLKLLGHRVSRLSAVFLAASLEYLTAEVLDLAGNETKRLHRVRIQPSDIKEGLRDDELALLTRRVILPEVHNQLQPHADSP